MLDTIYVEDTRSWRDHWTERSKLYSMQTICYESPERAIDAVRSKEVDFPKVFVLDYDFENSSQNGQMLGDELRKLGYSGPLVMSSTIRRSLSGFDLSINKANVLEVIETFFPDKFPRSKEKFTLLNPRDLSGGEKIYNFQLRFGKKNPFYQVPEQFAVENNGEYIYLRMETGINPSKTPLSTLIDKVEEIGMAFPHREFREQMEVCGYSPLNNNLLWRHTDDLRKSELYIERSFFIPEIDFENLPDEINDTCNEAIEICRRLHQMNDTHHPSA